MSLPEKESTVERKARPVEIKGIQILEVDLPECIWKWNVLRELISGLCAMILAKSLGAEGVWNRWFAPEWKDF